MSLNVGFFPGQVCSLGIGRAFPSMPLSPHTWQVGVGAREQVDRPTPIQESTERWQAPLGRVRPATLENECASRSGGKPLSPPQSSAFLLLGIATSPQSLGVLRPLLSITKSWPLYRTVTTVRPFLSFSPWAKPPSFFCLDDQSHLSLVPHLSSSPPICQFALCGLRSIFFF